MLRPSVVTSCSSWFLSELAYDVRRRHGDGVGFDVFIPRHGHTLETGVSNLTTPTDYMAHAEPSVIAALIEKRCRTCENWETEDRGSQSAMRPIRLEAAATYYPEICSRDRCRRHAAVQAIVNTLLVAKQIRDQDPNRMPTICVEIVAGALLKRLPRGDAGSNPWVFVYKRKEKLKWLMESLFEVVENAEIAMGPTPYAIALEFEPGSPYLFGIQGLGDLNQELGDETSIGRLCDTDPDGKRYRDERRELFQMFVDAINHNALQDHCGFNLDLAHLRIAGVTPEDLTAVPGFTELICHAHISDHPIGSHSRDLPLGTGSAALDPSCFSGYLNVLRTRASKPSPLPFTGAVALELEGCHDPRWIHASIPELKSILQ